MEFVFTALIQDDDLDPQDLDYEFPACFIVEAQSTEMALSWGNNLVMVHCLNNATHKVINTVVEPIHNYSEHALTSLPKVYYGVPVSDEVIGW